MCRFLLLFFFFKSVFINFKFNSFLCAVVIQSKSFRYKYLLKNKRLKT